MWNTLKGIWRTLDFLFWILTTLIVIYFLYSMSDGRFRFLFWQPTPAAKENALELPEHVKPRDEQPGSQ